jgi:hypothetical protein
VATWYDLCSSCSLCSLLSLRHVLPTQTQVTLKYLDADQMKDIRIKAAEFIHKQLIKGGNIPPETAFVAADVDVSNIDVGMYYGGFTYVRLGVLELAYKLVPLSLG